MSGLNRCVFIEFPYFFLLRSLLVAAMAAKALAKMKLLYWV